MDNEAQVITNSSTPIWDQMNASVLAMSGFAVVASIVTDTVPGEGDSGRSIAALGSTLSVAVPVAVVALTAFTAEAAVLLGMALGPFFFFMGIFQKFADWPFQWAKYMMATLISASIMAAVSAWGLALMAAFMGAAVGGYATGLGSVQVAGIMAIGGMMMSTFIITIPGLVMKLFSLASEGAASASLGGLGGRSGGFGASGSSVKAAASANRDSNAAAKIAPRNP